MRKEINSDNSIILTSKEDIDIFKNTINNPPLPNNKLKRAFKNHKEFIK